MGIVDTCVPKVLNIIPAKTITNKNHTQQIIVHTFRSQHATTGEGGTNWVYTGVRTERLVVLEG